MTDQDPMVAHRVTHAVEAAEHVAEHAEHAAEHVAEHAVTAEDAAELTGAVNKLIVEVHSRSVGFLIALTLIAALGIVVGVLLHNQSAQNARLEASVHEQCSLYELIIPSYRESARQQSPLGPAAYDNAYRQIQISADNLRCGIPHKVPGT